MKLFVILSRVPYPLEKGDKLRAYHQLKYLSKKADIYLCCLSDCDLHPEAIKHLSTFCKRIEIFHLHKPTIYLNLVLSIFSNKPFQVEYFYQRKVHKKVKAYIAETKPDHIYCQLIRTSEYAKNQHLTFKTLDYMDAFSKGVMRRIKKSPFYLRPFFKSEYKRLLAYENLMFEYFENKTIISEQDRELIYHSQRNKIDIVRNGVDLEFFNPIKAKQEYDLLFTGNMNYPPNIDGAEFLVNKILPLILKVKPKIKVLLAGATPHKRVRDLASDNVHVSGWVEDIRECYAKSMIFIAPMQIGTGLQNKLLEAMAMGLPCITSKLANQALEAENGENILIGYKPDEYAQIIIDLLANPEKRNTIASKGTHFVRSYYNWETSTQTLFDIFTRHKHF